MQIDLETVMARANELYDRAKYPTADPDYRGGFRAKIQSDQVKALAQALVEEINEVLGLLTTRPDGRVFMASPGIM